MNWGDVGKMVSGVAPLLGGILGGPLGAAAGQVLGSALGLGSNVVGSIGGIADAAKQAITPENVATILEKGGDALIEQIKAAEAEAAARWGYLTEGLKADAAQGQAINETMKSEIGHIGFWHWRNLIGYVVVAWTIVPLPGLTYAVLHNDAAQIATVVNLAGVLMPYFTIMCGLLGYVAMDNTRRTTTAMLGEHTPTVLGALATRIMPAVKK